MSKCRKWVLTLGLMAVTPGITMAAPRLPFFGKRAAASKAETVANNQRIADNIAAALRDAKISGYDIAIEQRDGTAILSGKVEESRLKSRASEIVGRVPGVKRVDNKLQVVGRPKSASRQNIQPVNFQPSAPGRLPNDSAAPLSAAAGNRFSKPAPSTEDNQAVAQRIADSLAQAGLSGYDVEVRFANGTAILGGQVGDPGQRARAEKAASMVAGVKDVQNRLQVGGQQRAMAPPRGYPTRSQLAMAAYQQGGQQPPMPPAAGRPGSGPVPMSYGHPGAGAAQAVYNSPNLPEHAWPSYASYPNYSQVAYPKQYSASAWPYIGPFYPYPQVPLGWRQVQLEWDDGSWNLNFRPRTDKWWWFMNPKNW